MQKRLEQLKNIVGHFNNEETVKQMIEYENNDLTVEDLDDEDEEEVVENKIQPPSINSLLNK